LPAKPEPASRLKRFDIRLRREPSSSTLGEVEVQGVQQFHGGPLLIDGKAGNRTTKLDDV
jgi:hypothetical protein